MKIYALYYYDRPLLAAWLSHYCQLTCIDEIIIQNQNWSTKATLYLLNKVAAYIDHYHKKIVVLPSTFKQVPGKNKRAQFIHYGAPTIQNRVTQFFRKDTWIWGAMDSVIYGSSYPDTEAQLQKFERFAAERAAQGQLTIGYIPYYCVYRDGVFPCEGIPLKRMSKPVWRHRLFRFPMPFACRGSVVHDNSLDVLIKGEWRRVTPVACCTSKQVISRWPGSFPVDLRLLHYHTLVRPSLDSAEFIPVHKRDLKNHGAHPQYYLNRLVTS